VIVEDLYYSRKLDQHFPTRLDILLYAHDGRGLGHASRSIAIGMAIRRLYPQLRVLFVSGAAISQSLIGNSGLDWIKLPSYASRITDGVSSGTDGPANFYKSVLGQHRKTLLAHIITSFRPKCVLVDHSPLGKRKELLDALEVSKQYDTKWILGMRAVIGTQKDFWSDELRDTFLTYYHSILWYGDSTATGPEPVNRIISHFGRKPIETGYVSRLYETKLLSGSSEKSYAGTISIPWLSSKSRSFLNNLHSALQKRNKDEIWRIFIHSNEIHTTQTLFSDLPNCIIEPVGERYSDAILNSTIAIIYGGYNSLMDTFAADIPAIVIMRELKDREQELHLEQLLQHAPDKMTVIAESSAEIDAINLAITHQLKVKSCKSTIDIRGSANSADYLSKHIRQDPAAKKDSQVTVKDKFLPEAINIPAKIKKGVTRWNQCSETIRDINPQLLQGPVLDFGCGVGYYVLEGLRRGMDIHGIDQLPGKIKRYRKLITHTASPTEWKNRCLVGDGLTLPFVSEYFDLVTSWWVFEHIISPGAAIREMVRVTRPGGVIVIRAQDGRTDWEGHCKIPWVPYLSDRLRQVWIEEFGKSPSRYEGVYEISQPEVISIFETLGCRTVVKAEQAPPMTADCRNLCTEEDVRLLARRIKTELDKGEWKPRKDGLYVYAKKCG